MTPTTPLTASAFAPTRWTLVLEARGDSPQAQAALGELCESYYQPVFRFLQREGRTEDSARELTQEFFARLLASPTDTSPGLEIAAPAGDGQDAWFDRQWALAVMDRSLRALAAEHAAAGKAEQFERLKPWLVGAAAAQADIAAQLGWSEGALKVAVHRMRKRFRELVRLEVAQTVPASADIDAELRYLIEVLTHGA